MTERRLLGGRPWWVVVSAAAIVALTAPGAGASAAATLTERTLGVTVAAQERTDAKGRVTTTLPSLRPWETAVRRRVGVVGTFISWGNGMDPVAFARAAFAQGATPMITWESWLAASTGAVQPAFANAQIVAGRWDAYIRRVARGLGSLRGSTYIRFDHEMNGDWYPWNHDPAAYIAAWRHVVAIFRQAGASNVKWVWAPNAGWTTVGWLDSVRPYWPGNAYVDAIGLTLQERYETMKVYGEHLDLIHVTWPTKAVVLPETNAMTAPYMHALVAFVSSRPWIKNVTWFERPAFGSLLDKRPMAAELGRLISRPGGASDR